jgi:hypothetical protein
MATRDPRKTFIVLTIASLCISLCGCQGLEYHDIYMHALGGAAVGAIVGNQSDECAAGAAVGAAIFATGELLDQIDDLPKERKIEEAAEEVAKGDDLLRRTHWRR